MATEYPVGTRVKITVTDNDPYQYEHLKNRHNGSTGTIVTCDPDDDHLPYKVAVDDYINPAGNAEAWVSAVVPLNGNGSVLVRAEVREFIRRHSLSNEAAEDLYHLLGRAGVNIN